MFTTQVSFSISVHVSADIPAIRNLSLQLAYSRIAGRYNTKFARLSGLGTLMLVPGHSASSVASAGGIVIRQKECR